jgi:hypothetical protein
MANEPVQPQPGRRPVYSVDSTAQDQRVTNHGDVQPPQEKPNLPPPSAKNDPAPNKNTESANHPNDE